jgi:hypothetical protein
VQLTHTSRVIAHAVELSNRRLHFPRSQALREPSGCGCWLIPDNTGKDACGRVISRARRTPRRTSPASAQQQQQQQQQQPPTTNCDKPSTNTKRILRNTCYDTLPRNHSYICAWDWPSIGVSFESPQDVNPLDVPIVITLLFFVGAMDQPS